MWNYQLFLSNHSEVVHDNHQAWCLFPMNNEWRHFFTSCASRMTSFILYCFPDTIEEEFHYSTQQKFFINWNDPSNWNFPPRDSSWISSLSLNSLCFFLLHSTFSSDFWCPSHSSIHRTTSSTHFIEHCLQWRMRIWDKGDNPEPQHRPNFDLNEICAWCCVTCDDTRNKSESTVHEKGKTHLVCFDLIRSRCDVLNASNTLVFETFFLEPTTKMRSDLSSLDLPLSSRHGQDLQLMNTCLEGSGAATPHGGKLDFLDGSRVSRAGIVKSPWWRTFHLSQVSGCLTKRHTSVQSPGTAPGPHSGVGLGGIGKSVSANASSKKKSEWEVVVVWLAPKSSVEVTSDQIHVILDLHVFCKRQLQTDFVNILLYRAGAACSFNFKKRAVRRTTLRKKG